MSVYRPERDWPRYVPVAKILVSVFDRNSGQVYGEVTNISTSGACIAANRHFAPDTKVLLRISFHHQRDPFVTQAEVVWSRNEPSGGLSHAHGVKFSFNEDEQQAILTGILESPDFKLEFPENGDNKSAGGLGGLMADLTEDLDKLGKSCHRVVRGGD